MKNKLQKKNENQVSLSKALTYISDLHYDHQHNVINVIFIKEINVSFNWKSKEFKFSRLA